TQLQALPHSRIPAHSTVLVLRRHGPHRVSSMDRRDGLGSCRWNRMHPARYAESVHALPALLVRFLRRFLHHLQIEAPRLHSSRCSTARIVAGSSLHPVSSSETLVARAVVVGV